jgi:hypothetical protein
MSAMRSTPVLRRRRVRSEVPAIVWRSSTTITSLIPSTTS